MSTPAINSCNTPYFKPPIPVRQVVEMTPDDLKEVTGLIQNHMELLKQKKSLETQQTETRQNIVAANNRIQANTIAAQDHMASALEHRARAQEHHDKRLEITKLKEISSETLQTLKEEKQEALRKAEASRRDCIASVMSRVFGVPKEVITSSIPGDKLYAITDDVAKECLKIDEKEMNEVILPFASAKKSQKVNFAHFKDEITEKAMLAFLRALPTNSVQLLGMERPLTPAETALKDAIVPTLHPRKLVVKQM